MAACVSIRRAAARRHSMLGTERHGTRSHVVTTPSLANALLSCDAPQRVHPEDRERVDATVQRVLDTGNEIDLEYRIVRPDDRIRRIHGRAEVISAMSAALTIPTARPAWSTTGSAPGKPRAKRRRASSTTSCSETTLGDGSSTSPMRNAEAGDPWCGGAGVVPPSGRRQRTVRKDAAAEPAAAIPC